MPQYLKIALKISAVFTIFALILLGNILLQEHDIQMDLIKHGCNAPNDLACLGQNPKGKVLENIDIGAYYMYISSTIFIFLSLLLFHPKHYKYLTPILTISWIILSEIFVRIFGIYVVATSLMGVITIFDSLYLGYFHDEIFYIIPVIFIIAAIAGILAYYVSLWSRKKLFMILNFCL